MTYQPAFIHYRSVLRGALLTIPFWTLVALSTPALDTIRMLIQASFFDTASRQVVGGLLVLAVFLLGLAGGVVAVLPLLGRNADGGRSFYVVNAVLGLVAVLFFAKLVMDLGFIVYECDFLGVPSCND